MAKLIGCRWLDYTEGKYADCEIKTCAPYFPEVKYWERGKRWTNVPAGWTPAPSKVQFCGEGRGRINGIFQCYTPNGMPCYKAPEEIKESDDG